MKDIDLRYMKETCHSVRESAGVLKSVMPKIYNEAVRCNYLLDKSHADTDMHETSDDYLRAKQELIVMSFTCKNTLDIVKIVEKQLENILGHLNSRI